MIAEAEGLSLSDFDDTEIDEVSDLLVLTSESDREISILKERWLILIDAENEETQKRLLERFIAEKLNCRALIS